MLKVADGTICFEMLPNYRKTVFKIDTMGNVVWNRFYEFEQIISFNEALMLNDSEIVVSAHHKWDGIPETPHSCNPFFLKFDMNGGIKEMKVFKYNSYCAYENIYLHNDYIYASGSLDSNWIYYGAIAKFDKNLEPVWQYKSNIDWDYYADIITINENDKLFMGSLTSFSIIDTNGIGLCNYSVLNEINDSLTYHEFIDSDIIAEDISPVLRDTMLNIIDLPLNVITLCINSDIIESNSINSQNNYIYPNPTNGYITINIKDIESIDIYNINGNKQLYKCLTKTNDSTELDLSNLPNGYYFARIKSKIGLYFEKFVIIEN